MRTVLCILLLACAEGAQDEVYKDCSMMLLQTKMTTTPRTLAMTYIPFNFGHTVSEKVAQYGIAWGDCGSRDAVEGCLGWQRSEATGCPLMYTPGKLWPQALAESHFGNRTAFGLLRDPYERLVAQFRGTYRLVHPELQCDVDRGVRQMVEEYLTAVKSGNPFFGDCNFLPQADFFDQPFGATLAVDNRPFPASMNKVFHDFGYDIHIETEEVSHVEGCDEKWAADLSQATKDLIYQVYKRDFELICERFGHCDRNESVCLTRVPEMCPPHLFKWNAVTKMYEGRA